MWCPISKSTCASYQMCVFKPNEDDNCLLVEALKVYIKNNKPLKTYDEQNPPKYKECWWD